MKEIGETFKEKREAIGLSIQEVCNDLEVTPAQIENLEDGSINAFKDVFFLKDLIANYAKYLNLDKDEIIEQYNSYVFDFTSKISLDEILSKTKEMELKEKETKKVISPYTKKQKQPNNSNRWVLVTLIVLIAMIVLGVVVVSLLDTDEHDKSRISYVE